MPNPPFSLRRTGTLKAALKVLRGSVATLQARGDQSSLWRIRHLADHQNAKDQPEAAGCAISPETDGRFSVGSFCSAFLGVKHAVVRRIDAT